MIEVEVSLKIVFQMSVNQYEDLILTLSLVNCIQLVILKAEDGSLKINENKSINS